METRLSKKQKLLHHHHNLEPVAATADQDRISNLPDHIIHHVFLFLPIQSVARTSLLSKRWRSLWHSFPDLDFTTLAASHSPKLHPSYADHILRLLHNHSDVRLLRFRGALSFSKLTALLRHAVKHNVQELDVDVSTSDYFNFPRCVIHSSTLKSLRLKSWHPGPGFRLPPPQIMKDGFKSLATLSLSRPVLHNHPSLDNLFTASSFPLLKNLSLESCFGLNRLRIECPLLEEISLESCYQLQYLEISASKLRNLRVSSCFDAYSTTSHVSINAPALRVMLWSFNAITQTCSLQNLISLNEALIRYFLLNDEDLTAAKITSVLNFLTGVSHCQSLTLENQCIEILSKNSRMSISTFNNLKTLEFTTCFNKQNNAAIASLLQSCPTVHTMIITVVRDLSGEGRRLLVQSWNKDSWQASSQGEEQFWESQAESMTSFLSNIKMVTMNRFMECAHDVSLIKLLLKHGKGLRKMFLGTTVAKSTRNSLPREKIKSQIKGFPRASSRAKVIFCS